MSFPSRWIQRYMFFMPYVFVFLTALVLIGLGPKENLTGFFFGVVNMLLFVGYLSSTWGNHYLKIISFYVNLAGLGMMLANYDLQSAIVLVMFYWVPATVFVFISLLIASISEIIPQKLYLSNSRAATSVYWPNKYGITHILDLTGAGRHRFSGDVKRVKVKDLLGSQGSLASVIDECTLFVRNALKKNGTVLVHCFAGQSRSAAFIIHYIMETERMRLTQAYEFVQQKRPIIDVSSDHMSSLRALDRKLSQK